MENTFSLPVDPTSLLSADRIDEDESDHSVFEFQVSAECMATQS